MNHNRSKRRGISLMMVTAVVAVAAVMGMAILSSNTLQAEASSSQDRVVQADALAESAVNVGLYYLQNINDAIKCPMPALVIAGAPYTETNKSLGASVPGTYDLSIARQADNRYQVIGTGRATTSAGTVQRTLTAVVDVNYFGFAGSAANIPAASTWTIPANTTITGDVYANCNVTNNGTVTGTLYAASVGGSGSAGTVKLPSGAISPALIPGTLLINHYTLYMYNGSLYTSGVILLTPPAGTVYGPTALNPAGVYTATAALLDLNANVKVNGTLVVIGGNLGIKGAGIDITPQPGFPALVVDGNITFKANNAVLNANGLTYIGGGVNRSIAPTGCILNVTGGLVCAGASATIDSNVQVNLHYDHTKTAVPSLTDPTKPAPTSVSIVSWINQ